MLFHRGNFVFSHCIPLLGRAQLLRGAITVKAERALWGRTVSLVATTTTARKGARKRNLFFATTVTQSEQVFNDSIYRLGQRP